MNLEAMAYIIYWIAFIGAALTAFISLAWCLFADKVGTKFRATTILMLGISITIGTALTAKYYRLYGSPEDWVSYISSVWWQLRCLAITIGIWWYLGWIIQQTRRSYKQIRNKQLYRRRSDD